MIANPRQYTITRLRRVRLRPAHSLSDFRVRLGAGTPLPALNGFPQYTRRHHMA